ncbi:hypothetical protein [Cellulomonas sp. S1-8]|uniref:hypothetical protein n=1 Tax=Cellulomonas sp. S1-8 TaxID=2904790 RepID=UPI002242D0EB|nr:hypothetical protein [Cellulomonas sp. S1-8]UZN03516.1 hypothetical protein OKX07_00795 [Cellulomonas sp. S1-8]
MTASRGSALWVARAAGVATTSVAFAVGAHVASGGARPTAQVLVALGAVTFAAATPLAGRRLRTVGLVPLLAALQLVVHTALTVLTGASAAATGPAAQHHGVGTLPDVAPASTHAHSGLGMLAAHGAAVVLTAALLAGADRAAANVARCWAFVAHVVRLLAEHVDVRVPRQEPRWVRRRPVTAWLPTAAPRRGPPALPLPGC